MTTPTRYIIPSSDAFKELVQDAIKTEDPKTLLLQSLLEKLRPDIDKQPLQRKHSIYDHMRVYRWCKAIDNSELLNNQKNIKTLNSITKDFLSFDFSSELRKQESPLINSLELSDDEKNALEYFRKNNNTTTFQKMALLEKILFKMEEKKLKELAKSNTDIIIHIENQYKNHLILSSFGRFTSSQFAVLNNNHNAITLGMPSVWRVVASSESAKTHTEIATQTETFAAATNEKGIRGELELKISEELSITKQSLTAKEKQITTLESEKKNLQEENGKLKEIKTNLEKELIKERQDNQIIQNENSSLKTRNELLQQEITNLQIAQTTEEQKKKKKTLLQKKPIAKLLRT